MLLRDQHHEEVAQLIVHLGGVADGLRDFGFHRFAEALAQAVNGDFRRALTHAELQRGGGLGKCACRSISTAAPRSRVWARTTTT